MSDSGTYHAAAAVRQCTAGEGHDADRAQPDVSIIVVNYNTRDMVLACLGTIARETRKVSFEVLIVDNDSPDGSSEDIARDFPQYRLFALKQNLGFAAGNNLAALSARGRYILLLNPDTEVLDGAIDKLVAFADSDKSHGIWGGRTVFADGKLNPTSCWAEPTLWSLFCAAFGLSAIKRSALFASESYGSWNRDTIRPVDIVTGCFLLIGHDLWRSLNGFDPMLFMYGEDADLCLRARRLGANPILYPPATIIHHGGASESSQAAKRVKIFTSRVIMMKRNWGPIASQLGRLLYLLQPPVRICGYGILAAVWNRPSYKVSLQMWQEIWQQRRRWLDGWNAQNVRIASEQPGR